jgi:prevent-host-death family protein
VSWTVVLKESVIDDLRWFGRKNGRIILREMLAILAENPVRETRNMKTLRPNPFAQRELRLFGKYRVLSMSMTRGSSSRSCSSGRSGENRSWFEARCSRGTMKIIPLSEAKANLSRYAEECHDEPVIVTINGVPAFQLVPLDEDGDLVDQLIEHHPAFARLLRKRLKQKALSAKEAARRL